MSDIRKWKSLVESMNLSEDPVQDADYTDHEVSMAKSQMLSSMKSINRIAKHLSTKSESEGLEGWTASKLTMAEDYLQVVADYMDGQEINEGYKIMPPMDPKYVARKGLEGPFTTLSGKVVYYDPKEGKYYDPDTDMYLSYEEFQNYDKDYSGMKEEQIEETKDWTDKSNWPIGLMVKHPKPEITQWYKWDGHQWVSKSLGYPVSELDPEIEPALDKAGAYEAERLKGMPNESVNEGAASLSKHLAKKYMRLDEASIAKEIEYAKDRVKLNKARTASLKTAVDKEKESNKLKQLGHDASVARSKRYADRAKVREESRDEVNEGPFKGIGKMMMKKKLKKKADAQYDDYTRAKGDAWRHQRSSNDIKKQKHDDMNAAGKAFAKTDKARRRLQREEAELNEAHQINWPYEGMEDHAYNAIRHGMHAYDAFDHVFSMAKNEYQRDWLQDNKDDIIKMFAKYGLQTEGLEEGQISEARWEFKPNTYMVGDRLTWDDKYEFHLSPEDADILNKFMQQAENDDIRKKVWRVFWNSEETGDTAQGPVKAIAYAKKKLGISEAKQRLDPKCWDGYKKQGTKMKGDKRVNNCVPK